MHKTVTQNDESFLRTKKGAILIFPTDAFQKVICRNEFLMLDHLSITCLSSPNQQYDQLVFSCRFKCIPTQLSIMDVPFNISKHVFHQSACFKDHATERYEGLWERGGWRIFVFCTLPNSLKIEFLSAKCSCPGFSRVEIRLRRPNVERHYN